MPAVEIVTSRLKLRSWKDSDFEPYARVNADPRVVEFLPWPAPASAEQTFQEIARSRAELADKPYGWWAVEIVATGIFVGAVGMGAHTFKSDFTPCTEIGWRLAHEHWGKGYATEAARAVLAYAFDTLEMEEIVSMSNLRHMRSFAVMKRIGLRYAREFEWPLLPENHPLRPYALYKMTRAEWRDLRSDNR